MNYLGMKKIALLALGGLILFSSSCKRDELDFSKQSDRIELERQLAAPLVYGEMNINDMLEESDDSLLVIDGDTVKMVFGRDSLFFFAVEDVLNIPEQQSYDYLIQADQQIPLPPVNRIELSSLINDTLFPFTLDNTMRIDSINLNTGNLDVTIYNGFNHDITLLITSTSLRGPDGTFFNDSIERVVPGETRPASFPIDNYDVITFQDNGETVISVRFTPVLYKTPGDDFVNIGDRLDINFGIDQIDDFNAIFGFFGYQAQQIDTLISVFTPDLFEALEGELNITNPKLHLNYLNSVGVPVQLDMTMELLYSSSPNVLVDLGRRVVDHSDDYLSPDFYGSFYYDRNNANNLDQLLSIPTADEINAVADALSNSGADTTYFNWALSDSELQLDIEIEVPMEFSANLTYTDTMVFREEAPDENTAIEVEYATLHFKFENYFPIGFGGELIVYDSIANEIIGSVELNEIGELLVEPAAVDANGSVIKSEVTEQRSQINIDPVIAEGLLNQATHLIFRAQVITTDYGSVNSVLISPESKLNYQFGIDAKGTYMAN